MVFIETAIEALLLDSIANLLNWPAQGGLSVLKASTVTLDAMPKIKRVASKWLLPVISRTMTDQWTCRKSKARGTKITALKQVYVISLSIKEYLL